MSPSRNGSGLPHRRCCGYRRSPPEAAPLWPLGSRPRRLPAVPGLPGTAPSAQGSEPCALPVPPEDCGHEQGYCHTGDRGQQRVVGDVVPAHIKRLPPDVK